MHNTDQLFESLFKRNFRSVDTKAFLNALAKEYPYFTAAQFYLLKQSAADSKEFANQAAKTALLFNNPFWLNFQLTQEEKPRVQLEEIADGNELNGIAIEETGALPTPPEEQKYLVEQPAIKNAEPEDTVSTGEKDIAITVFEAGDNVENVPASPEEIREVQPVDELIQAGQPIDMDMQHPLQNEQIVTEHLETTAKESTIAKDEYHSGFKTENNTDADDHSASFTASTGNDATNAIDDVDIDDETGNSSEKDTEPMMLKLNFDATAATTEDTISYQPLHTSDYFASLGIKLNENGLPVDRLGKQLKSFTDWLKVMKKIHPDQLPQTDELTEHTIQEIAEKSNKKGEILTEAMADVLIQQGKMNKAIELYQKLSLLNPSKSAYFAAKIDNIKR